MPFIRSFVAQKTSKGEDFKILMDASWVLKGCTARLLTRLVEMDVGGIFDDRNDRLNIGQSLAVTWG